MSPPFVRVVYPKLRGGYIFEHGAICFEALTPKVQLKQLNQLNQLNQLELPDFLAESADQHYN